MSAAAPGARTFEAPGKVFWIGEYAVLEGAPSVVAAVDRYVRITAEPAAVACFDTGAERLVLSDPTGRLTCAGAPPGLELVAAVAATLARAGVRAALVRLTADSSALSGEHKLGLGSSGAVAAGLVAALAPTLSRGDALGLALQAHRDFQGGRGSGADVIASSLGGLVVVQRRAAPRPITPPPDLQFAAIATGQAADTRSLIAQFERARTLDSAPALLAELDDTAVRGVAALERADVPAWLAAVDAYRERERRLAHLGIGIFTPAVERCLDAAAAAGWCAKPSGAGGGDLVVAFADGAGDRAHLAAECRARGVGVIPLALAPLGVLKDPGPVGPDSLAR